MKNTAKKRHKKPLSTHLYTIKMVKEESIDFKSVPVNSVLKVYDFIHSFYKQKGYDREVFSVIALDNHCNVIGVNIAHIGSLTASIAAPREIFKFAILSNAKAIVLAHNHPSGVVEPSEADIKLTMKLQRAGEYLGIEVVDHLVIGHESFLSILTEYSSLFKTKS